MTIATGRQAGREAPEETGATRGTSRSGTSAARLARLVSAILALFVGISSLAACASAQPSLKSPTATVQANATATAIPSVTPVPRLVYQADWSHGLAGWKATPGWTVSGGVLQSDLGSDREITSPFHPTTPNYAVQFRLQLVGVSQTIPTAYSLRADPSSGADGYVALFDHVMLHPCMFACHPHEVIYIDPMADQEGGIGAGTYSASNGSFQVHDFEPGTRVLTYRIEVRGSDARLLIDGHFASWAHDIKTAQLSDGPIRFYCTGVELRLSDFKVYSL